MPQITRKSIEEVRARANIVELIGEYTNLTRSGGKWRGLSPFSAEKTPSFFVDPTNGLYYCFSTSQGGDIFKFLMTRENLTFPEAVEKVAQRFGIPLEYEKSSGRSERSIRGVLFDIHEFARKFFRERFLEHSNVAEKVRNYWTQERGFDLSVAEEFSIGFLPEGGSKTLIEALLANHFSEHAIEVSGMFGTSSRPQNVRTRRLQFESRLIIPIRDVQGRVIAFTARQIPGITPKNQWEEAKYKNSSESEIFKKGQTLFNIDKAKDVYTDATRKKDGDNSRELPFVLVEGQLDAIRCYVAGMKSVVAGQGTGITLQQLQLLGRYSKSLDCMLDADAAGTKAALRLAPIAFEAGLELNFLQVPGGKDPDEFLRNYGEGGVKQITQTRKSTLDFIAEHFFGTREQRSSSRRYDALNEIYEILSTTSSNVFRSDFLAGLASKTGFDPIALERDFARFLERKNAFQRSREGDQPSSTKESPPENDPLTKLQEDILVLALQYDAVICNLADNVPSEWINTENAPGRILNRIIAEYSEGAWKNARESLDALLETDEERSLVARLSVQAEDSKVEDLEKTTADAVFELCSHFCKQEQEKIRDKLATLGPDDPEVENLLARGQELRRLKMAYEERKNPFRKKTK